MRGRDKARLTRAVVTVGALSLLALTGCSRQHIPQDTFHAAGPEAAKEAGLYWFVFWIAAAVFVLVEGLLIVALVRFRHRPGRGVPTQVHGNKRLEIMWTIAPALLLLGVAFPTVINIFSIARRPTGNVLEIQVVGHQWWWEVHYPSLRVTTANEIHIPVGRPVYVSLTSGPSGSVGSGVIHSFWVPGLAGKQDLEPGHTNHLTIEADHAGVFLGQCAEYCGTSHANMRFRVMAQPTPAFDAWVKQQHQPGAMPNGEAMAALQQVGCGNCHTITGVQGLGGTVGPDLTHFGSRTTFAGAILVNTGQNLSAWLRDPQAVKPGNDMTIGPGGKPGRSALTDDQIRALVAYLESLK
ncbi:MAG TPA: cytochrome c oxidase subunit II [Actinomycetota bacterium]